MQNEDLDDLIINKEEKKSQSGFPLGILALLLLLGIGAALLLKENSDKPKIEPLPTPKKSSLNLTKIAQPDEKNSSSNLSSNKTAKSPSATATPAVATPKSNELASKQKRAQEEAARKKELEAKKAKEAKLRKAKEEAARKAKEEARKKELEAKKAKELARKKELEAKKAKEIAKEKQKAQQEANQKIYIQIGSYNAAPKKGFLKVITSNGYHYLITKTSPKKLLVGPFESRQEAENKLLDIRDRINKRAFITKY